MRIPEDKIEAIRAASDIVQVVQGYVTLKKRGQNYFGLCPFHGENSPSFSVHPGRQIFRCFGCGKGGNVFGFLMEIERLTFYEAVKLLAEKAGIELPDTRGQDSDQPSEGELLVQVNGFARDFFYKQLTTAQSDGAKEARAYLEARGYGKAVVERFLLGYAPDGWEGLAEAARNAGLSQAILLQAGLVKEGRDPGRVYDAFRHRVMFPTRNLAGRVIAFNGRRLRDDDPAKYINSPETAVYHKGRELFGLWEARGEIRSRDEAILVEGPTDCLSLVMAGIPIAVASLGTSLTEHQARLLKRFTSRVFILYDGDSAGRAAARRAVDILLGVGAIPRVILLPDDEDPDSFVRKQGGEAVWKLRNEAALSPVEFQMVLAGKQRGERTTAVRELVASAALIESPVERDLFLQEIAAKTKVSLDALREELARSPLAPRSSADETNATPAWQPSGPLATLVGAMIRRPALRNDVFTAWGGTRIDDPPLRELFKVLYEDWKQGEAREAESLLDRFPDPPLRDFLVSCLYGFSDSELDDDKAAEIDRRVAQDCLRALEADRVREELTALKSQLSASPAGATRELLEQIKALQDREKQLRTKR